MLTKPKFKYFELHFHNAEKFEEEAQKVSRVRTHEFQARAAHLREIARLLNQIKFLYKEQNTARLKNKDFVTSAKASFELGTCFGRLIDFAENPKDRFHIFLKAGVEFKKSAKDYFNLIYSSNKKFSNNELISFSLRAEEASYNAFLLFSLAKSSIEFSSTARDRALIKSHLKETKDLRQQNIG